MYKLLFLLLFPSLLQAQIPLRHYHQLPKGPVLKCELLSYASVVLDKEGNPIFDKKPDTRKISIYENGLLLRADNFGEGENKEEILESRVEFAYDNGTIKSVEEYVRPGGSDKNTLKLHAIFRPKYEKGQLVTESVYNEKNELVGQFNYLPPIPREGQPLIVFDEVRYEKGQVKNGDRYGVQRNEDGTRKLHFQVRNNDTIFYSSFSELKDGEWRLKMFSSFNEKWTEMPIYRSTKFDAKGNELLELGWTVDEEGKKQYSATTYRYQYQGDPEWETATPSAPRNSSGAPQIIMEKVPQPIPPPKEEEKEKVTEVREEIIKVEEMPQVVEETQISSNAVRNNVINPQPVPKYFFPYSVFEQNGKFGCKDPYQRPLIPAEYDEVNPSGAYSGVILVRKGESWGVVDPGNAVLIPIQYAKIENQISYLHLKDHQEKYGLAAFDGAFILPCQYDLITEESATTNFRVTIDKRVGICDKKGKTIISPKYENLRGVFAKSDFYCAQSNGLWGLIARDERLLLPFQYEDMEFLEYSMNVKGQLVQYLRAKKNGRWGLVDFNNVEILPFEYRGIVAAADRQHFIVRKEDKMGVMRQDKSLIIPIEYVQITVPQVNVFLALNDQNRCGVFNAQGALVPVNYPPNDIQVTGKVIRVKEADHFLLYSQTGEFEAFAYTRREALAERDEITMTYYLLDGRKAVLSNNDDKCSQLEFFDSAETKELGTEKFIVLQGRDEKGKPLFGLRNARNGHCISPLRYSELTFDVSLKQKSAFTEETLGGSERPIAVGKISGTSEWVIIGSRGREVSGKK